MKILIYVGKLGGGGAERVAVMWANGFKMRGNDVKLIVNKRCENEYSVHSDVGVEVVKHDSRYNVIRQLGQIHNIRKVVRRYDPDVIITVLHPCGLYSYLATIGLGVPIINTEHNAFVRPGKAKYKRIDIINRFYINKLFNHITVLAQTDKNLIEKRIKDVSVLPNPLAFNPVEEIPAKQKVVLAMGRLDAWYIKGFDVLIKAWENVHHSYPDWKLQIAGAGSDKAIIQLKEFCVASNVASSVEFIGYFDNPEKVYKYSSIFVLSSRCEGFGMVVVEAMSQGCACVACDYGGRQKEIIRNETEGITCETDNTEQLSKCICRLIENQQLRNSIQKSSVIRSKDFSLDIIMDKWENIISKTL